MSKAVKSAKAASQPTEVSNSVASTTEMAVAKFEANNLQKPAVPPLTPAEIDLLAKCETTIDKGLKTFQEVGEALLVIRNQDLYRINYETFEDYCRAKWKFSARQGYRLIDASEVVRNLQCDQLVANEAITIPDSESCARPLAKLTPEKQVEAARIASKKSDKPTAKQYAEAAKEVSGKKAKSITISAGNDGDEEEVPRVHCYDPRAEEKNGTQTPSAKSNTQAKDNRDLEKLLEMVDAAQTQARKTINCHDVVKALGELAKDITGKLNGGAK